MTSGVLHAPRTGFRPIAAPLAAPAADRVVATIVVAGALPPALLDLDGPPAPWRVFRYGAQPTRRAYVPGRRGPHAPDSGARPPRRVEVGHPSPLLRSMTLVEAPGLDSGPAAAEILLDAAERAAGLVVVVDAARPLGTAEVEILSAAVGRLPRVAFVLTAPGGYAQSRAILRGCRAALRQHGPLLAGAPWLLVDPDDGSGVDELRRLLVEWSVAAGSAPRDEAPSAAMQVAPADDRWRAVLDREIRTRRIAAGQLVTIDLATSHVRCVRELGSGAGCPGLPGVLDRELHALSVRATRQLYDDTTAVLRQVVTALVDAPPTGAVLDRVRAAARRTVDALPAEDSSADRALLLTTTSGVAVVTGPGAAGSLSATGLPEAPGTVLAPIGIGLTASCYQMWQTPGRERSAGRRWVQQALRVLEAELHRELAQRYSDLHQAIAIIAADAVDHGVLLT